VQKRAHQRHFGFAVLSVQFKALANERAIEKHPSVFALLQRQVSELHHSQYRIERIVICSVSRSGSS
jgi:hypothetical protein